MSYLLEKTLFEDTKYVVKQYKSTKPIPVKIYNDDTVKDVLIRLAVASKQPVTSDHIYAWIQRGSVIQPLSVTYKGIVMDRPYDTLSIDTSFYDSGNRLMVMMDWTMHKLIEQFDTTIYFMTLIDYYKHLGLSYKNKITDEECLKATTKNKEEWFYGKIKKYWPRLKEPIEFFEFSSPPLVVERNKQTKLENKFNEINTHLLEIAYKERAPIYPKEYKSYILSFQNHPDETTFYTTVHLFRLFNDISLGEWKKSGVIISFTKLTLENYTDTCSKLWKDSIYYTTDGADRHVSKDTFLKWFHNPVISIPGTPPKYMNMKNSMTIKFYKDRVIVSLII